MNILKYWDMACPSNQVPEEYRMAYILSKLAPFEQVRFEMFHPDDKLRRPPQFIWRYPLSDSYLLDGIRECIMTFQGYSKWEYIKGSKNSSIEPQNPLFAEMYSIDDVPEQMREEYQKWIANCISDIPALCTHIESKFNIEEAKPQRPL